MYIFSPLSMISLTPFLKTYFSGAMESISIAASQNDSTTSIEARHVLDLGL
jgi:hypothetical protein